MFPSRYSSAGIKLSLRLVTWMFGWSERAGCVSDVVIRACRSDNDSSVRVVAQTTLSAAVAGDLAKSHRTGQTINKTIRRTEVRTIKMNLWKASLYTNDAGGKKVSMISDERSKPAQTLLIEMFE